MSVHRMEMMSCLTHPSVARSLSTMVSCAFDEQSNQRFVRDLCEHLQQSAIKSLEQSVIKSLVCALKDPLLSSLSFSLKRYVSFLFLCCGLHLHASRQLSNFLSFLLSSEPILLRTDPLTMILVSSSRWKSLCLALGLLSVCASANDMESTKHSLRGGEPEISRLLTGGGGVTIDFEEYGLKRGDYVTNQYEPDYGLTFSSQGGCGNAPRIFDTNNPVTGEYGDSDLGTPNESCWDGGPGWGKGGEKGQRGENCKKLDNVLIVQECNKGTSRYLSFTLQICILLEV